MRSGSGVVLERSASMVELTQGYFAWVDAEDFERVSQIKWHLHRACGNLYARNGYGKKRLYLHRFILGVPASVKVDHRDGDGLNCTRRNLRVATALQNHHNQAKRKDSRYKYKGVRFIGPTWAARIKSGGRAVEISGFETEEAAARAYDEKAREMFGEFARFNFPDVVARRGA